MIFSYLEDPASEFYNPYYECEMCKKLFPANCSSGQLIKDRCGCCDACARAEGESCGGMHGTYSGKCATGLSCFIPKIKCFQGFDCLFVARTCCCPQKTMVETREVFILDDSSSKEALDICKNDCVYRKEGDASNSVFCFKDGGSQVDCY